MNIGNIKIYFIDVPSCRYYNIGIRFMDKTRNEHWTNLRLVIYE